MSAVQKSWDESFYIIKGATNETDLNKSVAPMTLTRLQKFRYALLLTCLLTLETIAPLYAQPVDILEATGIKITGYADRMSVESGEQINFKITTHADTYDADLVRLIHGDVDPRSPGFKSEPVDAAFAGTYSGRVQTWDDGSFIRVPHDEVLQLAGSFTLQAWIYPTTPTKGRQGLLTKWSVNGGYGFFIDNEGHLALSLRGENGETETIRSETAFRSPELIKGSYQAPNWYFVAAVYDAATGEVTLYQQRKRSWPGQQMSSTSSGSVSLDRATTTADFIMGGYWQRFEPAQQMVEGHFNGKIDGPHIYNRALRPAEIEKLREGSVTDDGLVAAWDFAANVSSDTVTDRSANALYGETVHMPIRGVTGHNWKGREIDFDNAPDQYNAIYFHDDDLEYAGWETDFSYTIPADLRSGVYAARVQTTTGDEYIPFFVRPSEGSSQADIAFLAPTFTYLAYANTSSGCSACPNSPSLGVYHEHSDGSGVVYSSRLRPILDFRPRAFANYGPEGKTPRHFNADLNMIDWLEEKQFSYEVITDHDLHREGRRLLDSYNVIITGSHPEYHSEQMLDGLSEYLNGGGRLMYLGGNGFYWVTSQPAGKPHTIEVRKWNGTQGYEMPPGEYYHSTTGELGGLWRGRGRPPQELVGVGFTAQGYGGTHTWRRNFPYKRLSDSSAEHGRFIFQGLAADNMLGAFDSPRVGYGVAGDEVDRTDPGLGTPPHALVVARADEMSSAYQLVVEEINHTAPNLSGADHPKVRADMVYFQYPNEGAVFSVGSLSWFKGLSFNDYQNSVSQITENVLRRFMDDGSLPGP
jgi:N,N-dimethylformamidase